MTGHVDFWSSAPRKADHPARVAMLEALLWVGEPLCAVELVDVLDGDITMWDADYHLKALEALGVVEALKARPVWARRRNDGFDVRYRLKVADGG